MNKFEHISSPGPMSRLPELGVVGGRVALYSEVRCPEREPGPGNGAGDSAWGPVQ